MESGRIISSGQTQFFRRTEENAVVDQQKKPKTVALGVNVSADLKREFKKRCKELKYKQQDVIESLLQMFLNIDDVDAQSKLVRGEAKIIGAQDEKEHFSKRILSGLKGIAL